MRLSTKWNVPTFIIHHNNCEYLNLEDLRKSEYSSREFRMILDNDEAQKIFNATKKGSLTTEGTIILVALALGFLAMFYFFNTKLVDIKDSIENPVPLVEVIESE